MDRSNRWRVKARLYRDLGMDHGDPALREALFVAAEVYSLEADRVSCCGTLADPSIFGSSAALTVGAARRETVLREYCDESDEDQGKEEDAVPASDPGAEWRVEAMWTQEEGRGAAMDADFVRQQAAKYRKRAGEIADAMASFALRSLALTCEKLADDIEAREARRSRVFRARKPH